MTEEPEVGNQEPGAEEETGKVEGVAQASSPVTDIETTTPDVDKELQRLSRRGFLVFGAGAIAAYSGWKWVTHASRIGDVQWPLRRAFQVNEKLSEAYFSEKRMSPTFPPSAITNARINGGVGLSADHDPSTWRLQIGGASLTLDDIKALPMQSMITEFRCIEGWSYVAKWSGARLSDLMARFPPPPNTPFVALETEGRDYYVGLDMQSAMHPQTLLAYALNDQPLTWQHGAPLRLTIPVKYGIKNIKRVASIRYTNVRPADYWAERGYDWYAGH